MADQDVGRLSEAAEFEAHAATYHRITLVLKSAMIGAATIIASLIVTFVVGAGLVGGLIVGVVIAGVGVFALRHGWAHSSEHESGYPVTR